MKTIYGYLEPLTIGTGDITEIAEIWKASWRRHGWNPVIIGPGDVGGIGNQMREQVLPGLPTVNPRAYEDACYLRWAAMAYLGGWMADFDVLNYGFTVEDADYLERWMREHPQYLGPLIGDGHVPCLVFGEMRHYVHICTEFYRVAGGARPASVEAHQGKPHTSDMIILSHMNPEQDFRPSRIVSEFGAHGWETAPLVHYASGAMAAAGKLPKQDHMLKLRDAGI